VNDETQKRLELLKIARQQLSTQYIKDRADAYTQWNLDCDQAWRENGIKLPFPPPPPMPTEADIVAYALALHNAQNPPATPAAPPTEPAPIQKEPAREEPVNTPIPVSTSSKPTAPGTSAPGGITASDIGTPVPTPVVAEPTTPDTTVDVMPEVLPPPTPVVPRPVVIAGAADQAVGETAIKEIFNKPSGDPAMVANEKPAPSVVPLLKSMLKKGLLPTWVKSDNISGIKE
jgi:hypothetical protein